MSRVPGDASVWFYVTETVSELERLAAHLEGLDLAGVPGDVIYDSRRLVLRGAALVAELHADNARLRESIAELAPAESSAPVPEGPYVEAEVWVAAARAALSDTDEVGRRGGVIPAPRECDHSWQPAGMVFETQLLDEHGRATLRQPDVQQGRVYLVCVTCACHTYMATEWIGYRLHGSEDAAVSEHGDGYSRPAWAPEREADDE